MENNTSVEIVEPMNELEVQPQAQQDGLFDMSVENIMFLAEKAEKMVTAMNKIMEAAVKITSEHDWVLIGGKPYLQESGATKVARLFGVSWQIGRPEIFCDSEGYKTRCGIVESVFYNFVPVSVQSEYIYKGEAILSLRLASDSENLISTNDTSNSSSSDSIFDYISSNLGIDKISSWF